MTAGRLRVGALLAGGLLLVAVAVGAPGEGGDDALEPDGTGPSGARGLVLVLEALGADVDVVRGPPEAGTDTAVVLRDRLADADVAATLAWVEGGGVLLVADPLSPLAVDADVGACPEALADVDVLELEPDEQRGFGAGSSCFDGFVLAGDRGRGAVVALESPRPLTNQLLDEADNAVLAAALLAPAPGSTVAFVEGPSIVDAAPGDDSLTDLLDPGVRQGLVQAAVAVLLWVAWRARRLGRPVVEEQPVRIAGSELVVAVGRLLDGRRRPDEAAEVLRAGTRQAIAARLGLAADADVATMAAVVAGRSGMGEDRAADALGRRPVSSDDDLLAVAADLDRIRADLLGSRTT